MNFGQIHCGEVYLLLANTKRRLICFPPGHRLLVRFGFLGADSFAG